jgi:hypothetical protein
MMAAIMTALRRMEEPPTLSTMSALSSFRLRRSAAAYVTVLCEFLA